MLENRKNKLWEEINLDRKRAVFAKYKDNLGLNRYRFVGFFKCVGLSPEDESCVRYMRIDDTVEIVR